ncbi:MAG: creatininase family protein [Gemmatimonadales bacterium]|nr:creatininase family protein [Gemmatimonadales bacterium]NIN11971.1 creatininase family protein [Gemmatimonadales bacterium]NIN50506.1 creatininase family protein [Gemmatimonadales bacterium]NIP07970.1 creatininase family protein [Gemmatimonadales bacterium]NIR01992.1 creatininase family protein [Gemmatimonadales bacterium]
MNSNTLFLERMSWPEIEAALQAGMTTAVVPCGAVEQHGPHLPLFVDAEHGTRLGEEVARRLGNALVAPTIRVGCSDHHLAFPGTVSLREETFHAVCQDYCTSLAHHGFRYICLLPSHGGNCKPLANMVDDLNASVGPHCRVVAFTDLVGAIGAWRSTVAEETGHGERVGGHADIAESSVMLCLHPDLVREEAAEAGYLTELSDDVIDRIIRDGLKSVTPNGILGDARGMSQRIGARCIEVMADLMAEFFKKGA